VGDRPLTTIREDVGRAKYASKLAFLGTVSISLILLGCGSSSNNPAPPQITATLSTTSMTFGNSIVGTSSASQSITLTDNSGTSLAITNISAGGPFVQSNNCPASLSANAFCTIIVTFSPNATGTVTGSLNVIDSAGNSPQTVSLTGTGTAPIVSLSATSLGFGNVLLNATSGAQTVTLSNTGTGALNVTSIVATGDYAQTNTCGISVAVGGICTISVTFTPTALGTRIGAITITDSAAGSPETVSLSGSGIRTASFVLTGGLIIGRTYNSVTLLNNGKVLIAGGQDNRSNTLSETELYDSSTGTFTATGNMTTPRMSQTATLLPNGKVLIAGGNYGAGVLASAELYDSATGTFKAIPNNMTSARWNHTATLLPNSQVLITGGGNSTSSALSSAELYDPATGTFAATGSMSSPQSEHTATLLNNGSVLIVGGINGIAVVATASVYNPASGTFSATGSLTTSRYAHTATLLNDGNVLVTGGITGCCTRLSSAELYNSGGGTFTITGTMNEPRYAHTATLLNNGLVLVAAGASLASSATAELYDSGAGTFTYTASLHASRYIQTATLLNDGDVLIAGGGGGYCTGSCNSVEVYLPSTFTPTGLVSITVTPATPTLGVGATQQFIATGTFSDGSTQTLQSANWSSSNTGVATISNDASNHGMALVVASGMSTITASAGSISGSTVLAAQ
jgi:hypothetical protein